MSIQWEEVDSSAVSHLVYSEDDESLHVRYKNGSEYRFSPVSFADYNRVKDSSSIGRALREIDVRGVQV